MAWAFWIVRAGNHEQATDHNAARLELPNYIMGTRTYPAESLRCEIAHDCWGGAFRTSTPRFYEIRGTETGSTEQREKSRRLGLKFPGNQGE
jgi:hypothetical protein